MQNQGHQEFSNGQRFSEILLKFNEDESPYLQHQNDISGTMIDSNFEIKPESLIIQDEEANSPDVFRDSQIHDFQIETRQGEIEQFESFKISSDNQAVLPKASSAVVLPLSSQGQLIEDITDDSDEEKSIKEHNMQEIKVLQTQTAQQSLGKNFSEHDFLHKEFLKGNGIKLFKEFSQINFKFDNILMPKDSQEIVFSKLQNIVIGFLMGINATIFAYGQTGAGKTYSINGVDQGNDHLSANNQKRGILPRTIDSIFERLIQELHSQQKSGNSNLSKSKTKLFVSFFEIYNEKIYDLLHESKVSLQDYRKNLAANAKRRSHSRGSQQPKDTQKNQQHLELREEKDGRFSIPDLRKVQVQSQKEAYDILKLGLQRRATSSTSVNSHSSRSHSIFEICLEKTNAEGVCIKSKLRIVDLAGSEKYTMKKDMPAAEKSVKVTELTSINSSLSALGQCVSALTDPQRKHIPYRNSRLTKILKDSLDENSNLALIVCISPSVDSYRETLSTLQFADRAKKVILDGRNFSDSKLLQDMNQHNAGNQESIRSILKAYQEEKAIRQELENYVMEKNSNNIEVLQELERLKKQNEELQNKVKQLEENQTQSKIQLNLKTQSPTQQQAINQIQEEQKQTQNNKSRKSCLKQATSETEDFEASQKLININIVRVNQQRKQSFDEKLSSAEKSDKKRVRFAEKLDNDQSLDSDDRERIEHNLKYNDDTIFDGISIFQDLNNSGIIAHRLKDRKDVHPLKLKQLPIEDDEDEKDEVRQNEEAKIQISSEPPKSQSQNQNQDKQDSSALLNKQINDPKVQLFWGLENDQENQNSTKKQAMKIQRQEYDLNQDSGVSPIQKRRPNNSSQDLSKDLIDLENEGMRNVDSGENLKVQGQNISLIQGFDISVLQKIDYNQSIFDAGDLFSGSIIKSIQQKAGNNIVGSQNEKIENEPEESMFRQEESMIKPDAEEKENLQHISDSILGLDAALEGDNIPSIQIINNSQEIQNTLLLDSQSMIIEDPIKDQNLSQNILQHIDASSIDQNKDDLNFMNHNSNLQPDSHQSQLNMQFFSVGNYAPLNLLQNLQGGQISNANSSNMNTDVLTYSLTNTFSTIESLHDELTAIRNGLELSQKRGANILKTIQKYAREVEENKEEDEDVGQDEDYNTGKQNRAKSSQANDYQNFVSHRQRNSSAKKGKVDIIDEEESFLDLDNLNYNFVRDIKGFYTKIHQEITQLKSILAENPPSVHENIEQIKMNRLQTQSQQAEEFKSQSINKSPQPQKEKFSQQKIHQEQYLKSVIDPIEEQNLVSQNSALSLEGIERTQEIVSELRKEMETILKVNDKQRQRTSQRNKTQQSFRVLDLLEALQTSLEFAVTPQRQHQQIGARLAQISSTSEQKGGKDKSPGKSKIIQSDQSFNQGNFFPDIQPDIERNIYLTDYPKRFDQDQNNYKGSREFQRQIDNLRIEGPIQKEDNSFTPLLTTSTVVRRQAPSIDHQMNLDGDIMRSRNVQMCQQETEALTNKHNSAIDNKNLIRYEEFLQQDLSVSSASPIVRPQNHLNKQPHLQSEIEIKAIIPSSDERNISAQQRSRQRTPEIFKSLARLDESELGANDEGKEYLYTGSSNLNHQNNNEGNQNQSQTSFSNHNYYQRNFQIAQINNFFSQNSQVSNRQQTQSNPGVNSSHQDNPDFQITLRSYNFNDLNTTNLNQNTQSIQPQGQQSISEDELLKTRQISQMLSHYQLGQPDIIVSSASQLQQDLNNSDNEQKQNALILINNLSVIDRKKSMIGAGAADNTLTLIFDSDDEQQFQEGEDQGNDDQFGGEPTIQEVDEDENEHSRRSLLFNEEEESKIEQNRSSLLEDINSGDQENNNLITSNSFQADNSLLILAKNFEKGESSSKNQFKQSSGMASDSKQIARMFDNSATSDQIQIQNFKLKNLQKMSSEEISSSVIEKQKVKLDKKQNSRYLLPQTSGLQNASSSFKNQKQNQRQKSLIDERRNSKTKNDKDSFQELQDDISSEEHRIVSSFSQERTQKSTSKTSVKKYWNQFFNKKEPGQIINEQNQKFQNTKSSSSIQLNSNPQGAYGMLSHPMFSQPSQPFHINQSGLSMNLSTSMDQIPSEQLSNSKMLQNLVQPPTSTFMRNINGLNQAYSQGQVVRPSESQGSFQPEMFNSISKTKEYIHQPSQSLGGQPLGNSLKKGNLLPKPFQANKNSQSPILGKNNSAAPKSTSSSRQIINDFLKS